MESRTIGLTVVAVFLVASFGRPAAAQDERVEILRDVHHDVSAPLRDLPDLPPNARPLHVSPIHPLPQNPASAPVSDPVLQSSLGPAAGTSAANNFDGVGVGFVGPAGGFSPDAAPPDTNGAVGATQYVQWVNESYAVFDKTTG